MTGKFITLEGPEGSGKTTVSKELVKILKSEITTVKKVKRHYDWTRKICPSYMITKKYSGLTWNWFLDQLNSKEEANKTKYVRILKDINIHSKADFTEENTVRSLFCCFRLENYRRMDLESCFEVRKICENQPRIGIQAVG